MKKLFALLAISSIAVTSFHAAAQEDKSKRPSPPAKASQTISSGAMVSIDYGQPSVKGRTIGKDLEPKKGHVWRAGANEATVFEVSKNVTVEGKALPAGKYSLFMLDNGSTWTIIFNKKPDFWGTEYEANKATDFLKVDVTPVKPAAFSEKLTYTIAKNGKVSLNWGDKQVDFNVK